MTVLAGEGRAGTLGKVNGVIIKKTLPPEAARYNMLAHCHKASYGGENALQGLRERGKTKLGRIEQHWFRGKSGVVIQRRPGKDKFWGHVEKRVKKPHHQSRA